MKIDVHVHMVGTGSGGTGCWYRPRGPTRFGEPFMLRGFGLDRTALRGDLDRIYVDRILAYVRGSSLDAAVILAQEKPHRDDGTSIEGAGSFFVPNAYVLRLAREHPELLAGVSIHPARPDALAELERCLEAGAVLLKCLPNCQNIDWRLPRYTRFLERMAEAGLPLLAHTGGEQTLPVIDARLADPRGLIRPLEIGVTCIAAHCGTSAGLTGDYFDVFTDLLRRYPRLYGDTGAFCALALRTRHRAFRACLRPEIAARLLHGSDAPVPVHGLIPFLGGLIGRPAFRASRRISNPLERDIFIKQAMGFPPEVFTRAAAVLRWPVLSR